MIPFSVSARKRLVAFIVEDSEINTSIPHYLYIRLLYINNTSNRLNAISKRLFTLSINRVVL